MINLVVSLSVLFLVLGGLHLQGIAVSRKWMKSASSRKVAHLVLGLLLLLSWLLYDTDPSARWLAAVPPAGLAVYFLLVGSGLRDDERTVLSVSRSGTVHEMLFGPLLFCAPFAVVTVLFWRSPVSVATLSFLIFGDGLAEVFGSRIRSRALPWNKRKTVAGSVAALLGGWLGCILVFWIFESFGFIAVPAAEILPSLFIIAVVGAFAEAVSSGGIDNLTVTIACCIAASVVF